MKHLIVEKEKMRHNLALTRERARGAALIGVLKGDAYGLGLLETARLMRDAGVRRFAVSEPSEGALLRRAGFTDEEILLLRSTADPAEIEALLDAGLVATVGSRDAALTLSGLAERRSTVAEAHLKIDTGIGRYGFLPEEFDKILSLYRYIPNLAFSGVYTHLNAHARPKAVAEQMALFRGVLTRLQAEGIETGLIHAAGSEALFRHDLPKLDAVRVGLSVSGRVPGRYGLQSVGYLEAAVTEVRWLPKGTRVGTSDVHTCRRSTRVGILPVGLADGFTAERADRPHLLDRVRPFRAPSVRVAGGRARVLGNVGLHHTVIDITPLSCGLGDAVCLDVNPLFAARLPKLYR
ncbi:MAG: alanine racemase [Oscillospiraceae bacterium]|jgi:alanine racemase|nr:alanine racemase [Oscillospiraceae bacterium]